MKRKEAARVNGLFRQLHLGCVELTPLCGVRERHHAVVERGMSCLWEPGFQTWLDRLSYHFGDGAYSLNLYLFLHLQADLTIASQPAYIRRIQNESLRPCGETFGTTIFSHQTPFHSCSCTPQSTLKSGLKDVNFQETHTHAGELSRQTVTTFFHSPGQLVCKFHSS